MRRIWKIALSVAILMFWISFFALAWLVVGVFVFSIVTAQLLSCAAAPWLFAAAAILVVGGLVAACWEHGLLRKDFAAFRRLSASRRCVLTAFVVLPRGMLTPEEELWYGSSTNPIPGLETVRQVSLEDFWAEHIQELMSLLGVGDGSTNDVCRSWEAPGEISVGQDRYDVRIANGGGFTKNYAVTANCISGNVNI